MDPVQDSQYVMSFTRQLDSGTAMLYEVAFGSMYSSWPIADVRYTIVPQGKTVRVFAFVNISMNNGFGGMQSTDLTHGKAGHQIQAFMEQISATVH
jgi:hypothetical protein